MFLLNMFILNVRSMSMFMSIVCCMYVHVYYLLYVLIIVMVPQ